MGESFKKEMLKEMMDNNFIEVSCEEQKNINGGFNPAFGAVAYGVIATIPYVVRATAVMGASSKRGK